jgi:parallel beta helix pectate lyase-like protein
MRRIRLALLLSAGLVASLFGPLPVAAAGQTLYVDGKTGNDSNSGLSAAAPFKTIGRAAYWIPKGSAPGWTVIVKGYTDYIYRDRPIPTDFASAGTAAAHIVFQASGYVAGSTAYVKPIVSGADTAPRPGQAWSTTSYAGVWKTPWTTEPYYFGVIGGSLKTALFQNGSTWIWEQTSLSALATRATTGKGGFWWDRTAKVLYVSAVGSHATGANAPARYGIEVIVRPAFYFKGTQGVRYVDVRGFEVRHSANGIAFAKGVDYSTAADNVLNANFLMGIQTSGSQNPAGPDPAVGNVISRNSGAYNTLQLIKIDEGTQTATVCDNSTTDNALRGILVQGPPGGTGYTGTTTGITVCRNKLYGHDYNPSGSVYNNANGITIANGAKNVTVDGNQIWSNDVGIHVTQESSGRQLLDGIVLKNNQVWSNRRFGLNLYDGVYGNGTGKVTVWKDLYWANGTGIMVSRGSSNKVIAQSTVHGNVADGIRIGESGQLAAKVSVNSVLLTSNGGYGLWVVAGNTATLKYNGFSGNKAGSIRGTASQTGTNTKPPGYLSTTPGAATYLQIPTTSYQYTAGPSRTPIGGRY